MPCDRLRTPTIPSLHPLHNLRRVLLRCCTCDHISAHYPTTNSHPFHLCPGPATIFARCSHPGCNACKFRLQLLMQKCWGCGRLSLAPVKQSGGSAVGEGGSYGRELESWERGLLDQDEEGVFRCQLCGFKERVGWLEWCDVMVGRDGGGVGGNVGGELGRRNAEIWMEGRRLVDLGGFMKLEGNGWEHSRKFWGP